METKRLLFHVSNNVNKPFSEIGTKASSLSQIKEIVNVPQFWTIDEKYFEMYLNSRWNISKELYSKGLYSFDYSNQDKCNTCLIELDHAFSPINKYIVRSSIVPFSATDDFAAEISGAFDSIVCSGDEIANAIIQVYDSVYSQKARKQIRLFALENNIKGMAIIIQQYISAKLSGVVHISNNKEVHLQWIEGHLRGIVSGEEFGHSNLIYYNNVNDAIFRGSEKEIIYIRDNHLTGVFSEVLNTSTKLFDLFGVPQEIEWIFDGEKHWIVQSQILNETGKDKQPKARGE